MKQIKPKIIPGQTLTQLHDEIVSRREWTYRLPWTFKDAWRKFSNWIRHLRYNPNIRMIRGVKINGVEAPFRKGVEPIFSLPIRIKDMRNVDYRLDATTGLEDAISLLDPDVVSARAAYRNKVREMKIKFYKSRGCPNAQIAYFLSEPETTNYD